jgi:hypothetical protein
MLTRVDEPENPEGTEEQQHHNGNPQEAEHPGLGSSVNQLDRSLTRQRSMERLQQRSH